MKKRFSFLLAALLLIPLFLLPGCRRGPDLPEGMDEASLLEAADSLRVKLNEGDYQAVADAFRSDLKEEFSVDADLVKAAMDTAAYAGEYVRTADTTVSTGSKKQFDEPYAVAVLYCEHEEKDVIYEFSFDVDLDLIGLQIKPKK